MPSTSRAVVEAFPIFAPYGDFVLTKRGTLLAAAVLDGADFDALTQGDLGHVALAAAQVAEQLPSGASVTQYYIHLDQVPVSVRPRSNPLSDRLSKERAAFLNAAGLGRAYLYHVFEFTDPEAASTSLWTEVSAVLSGGANRDRLKRRIKEPGSVLLSRAGMDRLAKASAGSLSTALAVWSKLGAARMASATEFWSLLRYMATFDPQHLLDPAGPIPEDDLDIRLPAGGIDPVEIDNAGFLRLDGAPPRFARFASIVATPPNAIGWLTEGADAPLRQRGNYILVHHFEPLSEIGRSAKFSQARAAIERTRISIVNILKGEEKSLEEERRPKHKLKIEALEQAEARPEKWGNSFTSLVVPHERPEVSAALARSFGRLLTARRATVVWENVGLPFVFSAIQPGGSVASRRKLTIASTRHGALSLSFKSREGQPTVTDLGGEEATLIFESATGEPFHYAPWVNEKAVVVAVGPTRAGKTFAKNTIACHFLKYGGFVRAVDIDPGGKSVADVFAEGGRGYLALGEFGGLNPFISERDSEDVACAGHLSQLAMLMLEANDTQEMRRLDASEQKDLDRSIQAVMALPPGLRSFGRLFSHLGAPTRAKFGRWMEGGLYNGILNAENDAIGAADKAVSVWNLAAFRDSPAVLRPVLLDLFFRVTRSFEDPAFRLVPKLLEIDEAHHALSIPAFREYVVAKSRTWGKWRGGLTLWSQSPFEYGRVPEWAAIRSAASTFLFMADGRMDEEEYKRVFPLVSGDIAAIRRLVPKRQIYLIQPELDIRKVLTLRVGPEQYAINTSTADEVVLRDRLIAEFGINEGLRRAALELGQRHDRGNEAA